MYGYTNRSMDGYANRNMDDQFLFKLCLFFQDVRRSSGTSLTNNHLQVLNVHGFHVTLEASE
jgi:hypothetical protein